MNIKISGFRLHIDMKVQIFFKRFYLFMIDTERKREREREREREAETQAEGEAGSMEGA